MQAFPVPSVRLKYQKLDEETLLRSANLFDSFPIHSIHICIPGSNSYREKYGDVLDSDENTYFIIKDATAKCLIENSFLEHFVRNGVLLAISYDAKVKTDNFLSIIPPGKLVLSLEKNIAECLALQKENPHKKKKRKTIFQTIIIDLSCSEFCPGRKLYDFVSFELSKIDYIKFPLLIKWKPNGDICSQSLKAYFDSQGFECTACKPSSNFSFPKSVPVPNINFNLLDEDACEDILEWVGTQICDIKYSDFGDEYVNKFTVPESYILSKLHNSSFEGFYSKTEVIALIKEIRRIFEADPQLPFISISLSGFQDSFIATNGFQHFSSDDKLICLFAFPSSNYCLITLNVR